MIKLTNGYYIDVEERQYVLGIPKKVEQVNKTTGETVIKTIMSEAKYYSTLDYALMGFWRLMRRKKLSTFDGTLQEALEVVREQDDKMFKLLDCVREGAGRD